MPPSTPGPTGRLRRRGDGGDGGTPRPVGGGAAERGLAGSLPDLEFTVLELADRLLNRGVVLVGEATISVAGVDLIYLGLNVVLTAVENLVEKPPRPDGA